MKVLITGSSGYIGYVLSRYLSEKGIPVTGVDVKENPVWNGNDNLIIEYSFDLIFCFTNSKHDS